MAEHNVLGKWGEDVACEKLVREGYAIVERNWRLHHYEIDIIAMKGSRIIFIEVKTRANPQDDPILAVDRKKMRHIIMSANVYITTRKCNLEPQFDIIGVSGTPNKYTIEHVEDAFIPQLKTYR